MRSESQCLKHLASVFNSSSSLVMKPFVHHLRGMNGFPFFKKIEHLNVLEEILNITIIVPVNFCARRYICERFSDCGRGENFINKAKCRFELSINQHAKYFQFRRTK